MCIYFYAELLLFMMIILSYRAPKKTFNKALLINIIIWIIIFTFRRYDVGNDTSGYAAFFNGSGLKGIGYGTVDSPGETIESGFVFISKVLRYISNSPTWLFFCSSFIVWTGIYLLYKDFDLPLFSLLWLLIIGNTFVVLMVAQRQVISMGLILYSYYFLKKLSLDSRKIFSIKNYYLIISILLLVLAVITHRTSFIIVAMMIAVYFIPMNKLIAYIAICSSLIIVLLFHEYINTTFNLFINTIGSVSDSNISLLGDRYGSNLGETSASFIRIMSLFIPAIFTIYYTDEDRFKTYEFKCYITSLVLFILFNEIYMINRINALFLIIGYAAAFPHRILTDRRLYLLYLIFTIYYMWRTCAGFEKWPITDSCLPYHFIFE